MDRRRFLKGVVGLLATAGGAASVLLKSLPARGEAVKESAKKTLYGFGVSPDKCIGCGRCMEACKTENDVPREPYFFRTWVERYVIKKDGEAVVRTIDPGKEGTGEAVVDKEILRSF